MCITEELEKKFGLSNLLGDVLSFVELASQQGWLISNNANGEEKLTTSRQGIDPPLWLLAEVTYRCPLHCVFCYNPVDYAKQHNELTTDEWLSVLNQGREMSRPVRSFRGEPLLRDDLEVIVQEERKLGYYINLITLVLGVRPGSRI